MTAMVIFIIPILNIISLIIVSASSKKLSIPDIELNVHKQERFKRIRWIFNDEVPLKKKPVLFLRGAVLQDKATGKNLLQLKFFNIVQKKIKSVYAGITFVDDQGEAMGDGSEIQAEYPDVNCESRGTFGQKQLIELNGVNGAHIRIAYHKIVFEDGTVWGEETGTEFSAPAKVTLLKDILPPELQRKLQGDVICKPEVLGDKLWRCTCGCLVDSRNVCLNCQKTLVQAKEAANVSAIEKISVKDPKKAENKGGLLWGVLGFFFPFVGLILFLRWKNSRNNTAESIRKGVIAGGITSIFFFVLSLFMPALFMALI